MVNRKRKSETQEEEEEKAVMKNKFTKTTTKPTDQQYKPNPPGPVAAPGEGDVFFFGRCHLPNVTAVDRLKSRWAMIPR